MISIPTKLPRKSPRKVHSHEKKPHSRKTQPSTQMAIRRPPQKSAVDALMFLTTLIDKLKKQWVILPALCKDVKGAYDNVLSFRLLRTLVEMGYPPEVIRWINNFLT